MTYDWRSILYPAEWCFRFFIAALLVFMVSGLCDPIFLMLYWALAGATLIAFLLQVRIVFLFATGRIPEKYQKIG